MSKKCCGMTYFDEETVCVICGKELEAATDSENTSSKEEQESDDKAEALADKEDVLDEKALSEDKKEEEMIDPSFVISEEREKEMSKLTDIIYEDKGQEEKKKSDAPTGLKAVGIISLIMAIAGLALMLLCVYFLIIAPNYDKGRDGIDSDSNIPYSQMATVTDSQLEKSDMLIIPATQTDAVVTEIEESGDEETASETDAGEATATDAD